MAKKKVDIYAIQGVTEADNKAILKHIRKEIKLFINEYGRVYNEGGIYIADAEEVEPGEGIGCEPSKATTTRV